MLGSLLQVDTRPVGTSSLDRTGETLPIRLQQINGCRILSDASCNEWRRSRDPRIQRLDGVMLELFQKEPDDIGGTTRAGNAQWGCAEATKPSLYSSAQRNRYN